MAIYSNYSLYLPLMGWVTPEEVRKGLKVINDMIMCLYKPNAMEIIPEALSPLYLSFHHSDQFFVFTRQYANKQCTVPLRYKRR